MALILPAPSALHPRHQLVIEAFFDDSGKQDNTNFACIAGFLADTAYWTPFLLEWVHLNRRWNIRQVHMKDLWHSKRDFEGWDDEKKFMAISEYVELINKHKLIGVAVAVDAKFWNKLPREFQRKEGNAQEFCFLRIIRRIRDLLTKDPHQDFLAITFDHDRDFAKPRLTRYQHIIDRDPWAKDHVASICFANAWAYTPLQAADMLAWETNRLLEVRFNGARKSFGEETMFKGPDGIYFACGELWDEEEFTKQIDLVTGKSKAALCL
jgi:Protein of unknown function (DUF3800)